jgi:hypothetical protein
MATYDAMKCAKVSESIISKIQSRRKPPSDKFQLLLIVAPLFCNENEGNGNTVTDPDGSAGGSYIQ